MACRLLAVAFVLLVVPVAAATITIDGDFADWKDAEHISTGLLSGAVADGASEGNELKHVWISQDDASLYLSILGTGPLRTSTWGPTLVAIDADLNGGTGFASGLLGVDYLVQPRVPIDGTIMVFKRLGGENNTVWSKWEAPVLVAGAYAVGKAGEANRVEMRIPWSTLGISDPKSSRFRFRVCDGSPFLDPAKGSWIPAFRLGYFSFGNDPARINAANLCPNGDFENLQEAAARPLPQAWSEVLRGSKVAVDISDEAASGKHALHMKAGLDATAGLNSSVIRVSHGLVRFQYRVLGSSQDAQNLEMHAIGLSGPAGSELTRCSWSPPKGSLADGKWRNASFEFDFSSQNIEYCLIAPRINEATKSTGDGEWLVDDVQVYTVQVGPQVKLAHVWTDKPLARTGDSLLLGVWVENSGDQDGAEISLNLSVPDGIRVAEPVRTIKGLPKGSWERLDWQLSAEKPGPVVDVRVTATWSHAGRPTTEAVSRRLLVIDRNITYSRQELCTDASGDWRLLQKPSTLQAGNAAPLAAIPHKKSSEIKRSLYGICVQLPRSKDYEDPFNAAHLIDDDPSTCWSSQQNASPFPGRPPWASIDLGRATTIKQINLVPYWRNTAFPLGFSLCASLDGNRWETILRVRKHNLTRTSEVRGDKYVQCFPLDKQVEARYVRVEFERLPLSDGNYAEVSQGYKARLSGIEVIDTSGQNVALTRLGARAEVSDYFTGWQNTAANINKAFPKIMEIGLKWVRVGQWGDQTEWAAVEREKGKFHIDEATDEAIRRLTSQGVDILYGLNYGNALYERPKVPWLDIGPIYTEGHPFYLNGGPRTEEGRQAFVRYVDFVVRKYRDSIKWWELWNEENGWFPGHEPELYGKLLTAVARHIKSIDPSLRVMYGGTAAPTLLTTEIALREGAAPYVDAYAFHPYGINKPEGRVGTMEFHQGKNLSQSPDQVGWKKLEDVIEGVRQPFARNGNPNVQVWMDEWGTNVTGRDFTYNPGIGECGCAKYIMRFYIYAGWLNVPTAWWALHTGNKSQDWGILDPVDFGLRPMSYALQNVCSVVSDVTPIRDLKYTLDSAAPDPKLVAFERDDKSELLVLLWAAEECNEDMKSYPGTVTLRLAKRPSQVIATDLYWGVAQPLHWTYADEELNVKGLAVTDYPIVISCRY